MTGAIDVKLGAGYRRIDTGLSINGGRVSGGAGIPIPFSLDETTNTGYLGGYIGAGGHVPLGGGFAFTVDGDVGIYWAHTDYHGRYVSTGGAAPSILDQSLKLDRDTSAVIASLKVGLDKDFGAFRAGLFGRGEYAYSYAPEMNYNDVDRVLGPNFPIGGSNDGTSIGQGDAWAASIGGHVTVPFTQ